MANSRPELSQTRRQWRAALEWYHRVAQRISANRQVLKIRSAASLILGWIPLSWRGLILIPLLLWLLEVYWVGHSDRMLLVVATGCLALITLLAVCVLAVALWLRFRTEAAPDAPWELVAEQPFHTGFRLGPLRWMPLVLVEIEWESPPGVVVELSERGDELATASQRAHVKQLVRRFVVQDSWALTRIRCSKTFARELRVMPIGGRINPQQLALQYASGDALPNLEGKPEGDPLEMRQYAVGDPLKMVLWKLYARTGKMMVRIPERAISPVERTMTYLVAGPDDEPSAGIACALIDERAFGDEFCFGADGTPGIARTIGEARERIAFSANAREDGALLLNAFLAEAGSGGVTSCLLFLPSRPGVWLDRLEALTSEERQFSAIIGIDGLPQQDQRSRWQRLLFSASAQTDERHAALADVCRRLGEAGVRWQTFDRQSGLIVELELG